MENKTYSITDLEKMKKQAENMRQPGKVMLYSVAIAILSSGEFFEVIDDSTLQKLEQFLIENGYLK